MDQLDVVTTLDGLDVSAHLHFVRFDADGEPKFDALAHTLVRHIVRYSLCARTRGTILERMEDANEGDLFIRARDLFRKIRDAGETGELLLFFLLESLYNAPQVVCKMELKTNPNDEVKGADAIHVRWDTAKDHLKVFLGESKLYASISDAITSALKSIQQLHDQKRSSEELSLVTSHFKFLDDDFKNAVIAYLDEANPAASMRVTHACLIGWDWNTYRLLTTDRAAFVADFKKHYSAYLPQIRKMLAERFAEFKYKHLSFQFMFLPFRSVQEFRDEFYRVLLGGKAT